MAINLSKQFCKEHENVECCLKAIQDQQEKSTLNIERINQNLESLTVKLSNTTEVAHALEFQSRLTIEIDKVKNELEEKYTQNVRVKKDNKHWTWQFTILFLAFALNLAAQLVTWGCLRQESKIINMNEKPKIANDSAGQIKKDTVHFKEVYRGAIKQSPDSNIKQMERWLNRKK